MENTQTQSTPPSCCFTCHKLQAELPLPLKHCAKCHKTLYCSRKCQKEDWKNHKRICASQASSSQPSTPPSNSQQQTGGPHTSGFHAFNQLLGLSNDDYLYAMPEKQALTQLIDCFRMRVEDEYTFGANNIGIYANEDPFPEFEEFLDLAESRPRLLPPWWNAEKRRECERLAVDDHQTCNIHYAVEKSDIQEEYKDNMMPAKLRILGEKIYGKGFM